MTLLGTIRLWDIPTQTCVGAGSTGSVDVFSSIAVHDIAVVNSTAGAGAAANGDGLDGRLVAAACEDGIVRTYDLRTKTSKPVRL